MKQTIPIGRISRDIAEAVFDKKIKDFKAEKIDPDIKTLNGIALKGNGNVNVDVSADYYVNDTKDLSLKVSVAESYASRTSSAKANTFANWDEEGDEEDEEDTGSENAGASNSIAPAASLKPEGLVAAGTISMSNLAPAASLKPEGLVAAGTI